MVKQSFADTSILTEHFYRDNEPLQSLDHFYRRIINSSIAVHESLEIHSHLGHMTTVLFCTTQCLIPSGS